MPKVSVIVPVYNTEKYLPKCLDSLLGQTLADIEVICINDASTDGSLDILKKYAKSDDRIKLIDFAENKGASVARNKGIDNAKGEYIGFIDSDDFVDSDFYEKLYTKAIETAADVVKGNVYDFNEESQDSILTDFYNINYKISYNKANFLYGFTSAVYKRSFVEQFKIEFPEDIHYFEDPYFSIMSSLYSNRIMLVNNAKYYYVRHPGSLSSDWMKEKSISGFCDAVKYIFDSLNAAISSANEYYRIYVSFLVSEIKTRIDTPIKAEFKSRLKEVLEYIIENVKYSKEELLLSFLGDNKGAKSIEKSVLNRAIKNRILVQYKTFDYLNKDSEHPLIKILVSYIKPSFLFQSKILTPIHLGRSVASEVSKDGEISMKDYKWLYDNCMGDDDFEGNISAVNRKVGFLTGTWWAYKNYEKLGNPEYFGSFGYRRLFNPKFLKDLRKYDAIIPVEYYYDNVISLKQQSAKHHGTALFKVMRDVLQELDPEDIEEFDKYMNKKGGYFYELYVLKKELFFEFCNWIFPIMFKLLSLNDDVFKISKEEENVILKFRKETKAEFELYSKRNVAFIIERLTGFFLYKIKQKYKVKVEEVICTGDDYSQKYFEQRDISSKYKEHIDELNLKRKKLTRSSEKVSIISVVNNYEMYEKYYKNNSFINALENIQLVDIDNTKEDITISKRYNQFLNGYDYSKDSWFIFSHPDWEVQDDINGLINTLDKNKIYGPAGCNLTTFKGKLISKNPVGFLYEAKRDGSEVKIHKIDRTEGEENNLAVDTLDCVCMFVHSSLIKKYNLRFDENLNWDLYVEDFCINASKKHGIEIDVFEIENTHHSDAGFISLPISYYESLQYLNKKYPDDCYCGNCSLIGGKEIEFASEQEKVFFDLRKKAVTNLKK